MRCHGAASLGLTPPPRRRETVFRPRYDLPGRARLPLSAKVSFRHPQGRFARVLYACLPNESRLPPKPMQIHTKRGLAALSSESAFRKPVEGEGHGEGALPVQELFRCAVYSPAAGRTPGSAPSARVSNPECGSSLRAPS